MPFRLTPNGDLHPETVRALALLAHRATQVVVVVIDCADHEVPGALVAARRRGFDPVVPLSKELSVEQFATWLPELDRCPGAICVVHLQGAADA